MLEFYFTPDMGDIRVGYECEMHDPFSLKEGKDSNTWKPKILSHIDIWNVTSRKDVGYWIRVPYLTKEQIEAEGWENKTNPLNIGVWSFEKGNRFIVLRMNDLDNPLILQVIVKDPSIEPLVLGVPSEHFRFICPCKDINTFRYICKLLGI